MEDRNTVRCKETVCVVEANSNEVSSLWKEWQSFVEWKQDMSGYMETIGTCARRPVVVSVFWYTINGHRVAFYEPTSQVVDYEMVEKWLEKTFPCLQGGTYRHYDANNFGNCLSYVWPHEQRSKRLMDEKDRRFQEELRELWREPQ